MRIHVRHLLLRATQALLDQWARWFGHDLFLSYRRTDGLPIARWLHDEHSRHYLVFFDRTGIDFGERFDARIGRAVRKAKMLVVVLTQDALKAEWVKLECDAYRERPTGAQRIVPVFVHPITPENLPPEWWWIRQHHGFSIDANHCATIVHGGDAPAQLAQTIRDRYASVRRRAVAVGTTASTLLLALLVGGWSLHAKDLRARRDAFVNSATALAGDAHYLEAAQQVEQAIAATGSDAELAAIRRSYLDRAPLRPFAAVAVPDRWSLLAIGSSDDEPRLVLRDGEADGSPEARITIASRSVCLHVVPTPGESQPQHVVFDNVLFLAAGGALHRVPLANPKSIRSVSLAVPSNLTLAGFDANEIDVRAGSVRVLARAMEPPQAMVFDASDLSSRGAFTIPVDEDQQQLARISRRDADLVFVLGRSRSAAGLQLNMRSMALDGTWRPARSVAVPAPITTAMRSLYRFELAPDDGALFAAIHEQDFLTNRTGVSWLGLDLTAPRPPLWLENAIERLRAMTVHGAFEALYRLETRELRALQFVDFMRLDRPAVTVASRADAWAIATASPAGHAFRAFSIDGQDLRLHDDTSPGQRSAWRPGLGQVRDDDRPSPTPLRLHVAADGSFVAAEFDDAIDGRRTMLIWRVVSGGGDQLGARGEGWPRSSINSLPN